MASLLKVNRSTDESMLTGEVCSWKGVDDKVVGATFNQNGFLRRATPFGEEAALARICPVVEQAQGSISAPSSVWRI